MKKQLLQPSLFVLNGGVDRLARRFVPLQMWGVFSICFIMLSVTSFAQGNIKWPTKDDLVFQRLTGLTGNPYNNFGFIDVYGYFEDAVQPSSIKVSFEPVPGVANNAAVLRQNLPLSNEAYLGREQPWRYDAYPNFVSTSGTGKINFVSTFKLSPGYYNIRVVATTTNNEPRSLPLRRVGIGDVYVIAGQSNAAGNTYTPLPSNYYDQAGGMIQYHNEKSSFDDNDPGSTGRGMRDFPWYWIRLGQKLVENQHVPVAFYQAAWSGTSVFQWAHGFNYNMDGNTTFFDKNPYKNLDEALRKQVLMYGLRAVLWMQGENHTKYSLPNPTPNATQAEIKRDLNAIINQSRNTLPTTCPQPNCNAPVEYSLLPWIVAIDSWDGASTYPAMTSAQNEVISGTPYVYTGPSLDNFTGPQYRYYNPNLINDRNLHLGGDGLEEAANQWYNSILSSGFQGSRNYINEQAMAVEYGSGRLSAEYITGAVTSSFVWTNKSTGETRTGVNYIDNPNPGEWATVFSLPDGRTCQMGGFYVPSTSTGGSSGCSAENIAGAGNSSENVTYNVNVSSGGTYTVKINYSEWENSNGASGSVKVNGGAAQSFNVNYTGSPDTYQDYSFTATLNPGNNSFQLFGGSTGYLRFKKVCVQSGGGCNPPAQPSLTASPSSINSGGSSNLTATGCSGSLIWSTGQTQSSISVSPSSTTTYYANCTVGGCTSGNAQVTVTVNNSVDPCNLSSPVQIGTWNGYPVQLMQFDGNKVLATVLTGGPNGSLKYYARGKNYWNSISRNANTDQYYGCINVGDTGYGGLELPFSTSYVPTNYSKGTESDGAIYYYQGGCTPPSAPSLSASPGTINSGGSSNLTASNCSGTVTWSTGQTGNSITVSPGSTTTYYANCSTSGCTSGNNQVTVIVNGSGSSSCSTDNIAGAGNIYENITYTVNVSSAGTYTVKINYSQWEGSGATNARVKINNGSDQYFNASSTGGPDNYADITLTAYLNSGSNTFQVFGGTSGYIRYRKVCVQSQSGGRLASSLLGNEEVGIQELTISPNPNKGDFKVSFYAEPQQPATLQITDMKGKAWLEKSFLGEGYQTQSIHLEPQATGMLILSLKVNSKVVSKKIIVN